MSVQTAAADADYGTTASGSSFYAAMRILPRGNWLDDKGEIALKNIAKIISSGRI